MATKAQKAYILNSDFAKKYKAARHSEYHGNTHRDKWGFQDMLDDLGEDKSRAVIDWFFDTDRGDYSAQNLFNNYEKIAEAMEDYEEEKKRTMELLEATRRKVEEARQHRGLN